MKNNDVIGLKRNRGRPRKDENRDVVHRLLDATEELLRHQSHYDLTERKIAAVADVHEAMIHYYFGDKDGLVFAVVVQSTDDTLQKLKALDAIDPATPGAIRAVFKIVIDAFYAKPWITKIAISEFTRPESAIRTLYLRKYGPSGQSQTKLRQTFVRFIEAGIYERGFDPSYAALSMLSIVLAPFVFAPFAESTGTDPEDLKKEAWIDHVARLFAATIRPSSDTAPPKIAQLSRERANRHPDTKSKERVI